MKIAEALFAVLLIACAALAVANVYAVRHCAKIGRGVDNAYMPGSCWRPNIAEDKR